MIRLIGNELKKVFHKKGIYVVFGLMIGVCFLNNFLYFMQSDVKGNDKNISREEDIREFQQLEKEWEQCVDRNTGVAVAIRSKMDLLEMKKEFAPTSWQYQKLSDYLYELVYQKNYYTYLFEDVERFSEVSMLLEERIWNLRKNNGKYFLMLEKESLEEEIKRLQEEMLNTGEEILVEQIQKEVREKELEIQVLNYRIKNLVYEDNTYLDVALDDYLTTEKQLVTNIFKKKCSREEEVLYREVLNKNKRSQYILRTKKDIDQKNTLNYQLRTILEDYEIFFVVLVLMVSVILVCDEFRSGTVKLLLIKPYSRFIILLSKYFTALLVLLFGVLVLILAQVIFGGFMFGIDSLKEVVVVYHFDMGCLVTYPIFSYMMKRMIARIPFYLLFILISFGIGVTTVNGALAILIPFVLYLCGPMMLDLALLYHLDWMKYFIFLNWNFQDYLFGGMSVFSNWNFLNSVGIWIGYFIGIFILTFGIFRRKDIKNI